MLIIREKDMTRKMTSILLLMIVLAVGFIQQSDACTNVLITKGASADGSTMISYAADSHDLYGELYFWKGQEWPEGALLDIYEWDSGKFLGKIPQVKNTYTVIGNMNEHQLAIAETTFGGRSELTDSTGIMDYGSLIYIALQRARTAREAIKVMTELTDKFGYYSSGESFSIADPNEVWIMEMIGKGPDNKGTVWVAMKIPDGYISAHANQARITTFDLNDKDNVLYSNDVISFARKQGYFDGKNKDFSFADAYAPLDFGAIRFCEARVWSAFRIVNPEMDKYLPFIQGESDDRMPLFIKPEKKVSARDVQNIMRDHYEGTPLTMTEDVGAGPYSSPYRWRPMTWEVEGVEYFNERAISTQQTAFSFVAQMRSWLPDPVGGILWFGVDDANMTVYLPMYMGMNSIPKSFATGEADLLKFSWNSAFWVFNWVANQAYHRYSFMIEDIRKVQNELEDSYETYGQAIDQAAKSLYDKDPTLTKAFLTDYSHSQSQKAVERWKALGEFLMVKYLDGNLHEETDGIFLRNPYGNPAPAKFPGYDKGYYERIIEETGDRLKVR